MKQPQSADIKKLKGKTGEYRLRVGEWRIRFRVDFALVWGLLYGAIGSMGGSTVRPVLPKTMLSNLAGHIAYGAITSSLITRFGDQDLFDVSIPLTVKNTDNDN